MGIEPFSDRAGKTAKNSAGRAGDRLDPAGFDKFVGYYRISRDATSRRSAVAAAITSRVVIGAISRMVGVSGSQGPILPQGPEPSARSSLSRWTEAGRASGIGAASIRRGALQCRARISDGRKGQRARRRWRKG